MTHIVIPGPGGRDVTGTLSGPETDTDSIVLACPPHPEHGGHRGDPRLVAVSDALAECEIACLRIDYGEWDEGRGERGDVRRAISWTVERYDRVAVFGFSFGSAMAILASDTACADPSTAPNTRPGEAAMRGERSGSRAEEPTARTERSEAGADGRLRAVCALAPPSSLGPNLDVLPALTRLAARPTRLQVIYGERDSTVDWEPVVERAENLGITTHAVSADHFFVGQHAKVAAVIASFFETAFE